MTARNGHQCRQLVTAAKTTARMAHRQRVRAVRKTALGFDFQKAGDIGFRQVRHFRLHSQRPGQWNAHGAAPFANTGLIQMISNLASDQFRIASQRIQRERSAEVLQDLKRTVGPAQAEAIEAAAVERESQDRGRRAFLS